MGAIFNKDLALQLQQKYDEAIEYYNKTLSFNPNHTNAMNGIATVLFDQQKFDKSLQYFDQVLSINPNDIYALNGKIIIFSSIGNIMKH